MTRFNNQNNTVADEWEQLKRQKQIRERNKRIEVRNEQIDKRKEDNHKIFKYGELFKRIFPVVSAIEVYKGKDSAAKNAASLKPLEIFLTELAGNDEIVARLDELLSTREP